MNIGHWWESQKERGYLEGQDVGGWTVEMEVQNSF
jgi:hypothetical protein